MNTKTLPAFHIIGISVRTTNQNAQAAEDIPALWNRFMGEQIGTKIPNRIDGEVLCMYTEYESDYTAPYATLLGCRVSSLDEIPEGMIGKSFPETTYSVITIQGNMYKDLVINAWHKIWDSGMDRTYMADFEVYGEKAGNPENAEIDIYIS